MATKITVGENGSLKVEGEFELLDVKGQAYSITPGKPIFICRCGQSKNSPYCDGSHRDCKFESPSEAR